MPSAAYLTDLAVLYRQLAVLTGAGITAGQSAGIAASSRQSGAESPRSVQMRRVLETIKQRLWQGGKLSQAMAEWPRFFPRFHMALIAEGEISGALDVALARLADLTERDLALTQELRKQTFRPNVILTFAIPILILGFRVEDVKTVAWIACGIVAASFVFVSAVSFLIASIQGQASPTALQFAMATPGVGAIARKIAVAYFVRTLGLLYGAGVPVAQALEYAAEASGNPWLARPVRRIIPQVQAGQSLRDAFVATGVFPHHVLAMLAVAQETGTLDAQMDRVARLYEYEVGYQLRTFCMVVGAATVVITGALIAIISANFWKNYYSHMIDDPFSAPNIP